jgi:DNA-binding Lrp family transcriptional regulator
MNGDADKLSRCEQSLLNDFQRDFPLSESPFADMAEALGMEEEQVLKNLQELQSAGAISRVGPVFHTGRVGASSLVAMSVPDVRLEEVAEIISSYVEVNHNYEREHNYNLWFVVTASSQEHLQQVLDDMGQRTALEPLVLPMLEEYHIDLGFHLQWN